MEAFAFEEKTPRSLNEWANNFRLKKKQMKRVLRTSRNRLRITAILSNALNSTEHQLQCKQQQRFSRWMDLQASLQPQYRRNLPPLYEMIDTDAEFEEAAAEYKKECETKNDLWKSELLCDLDVFMRSLSGSSNNSNNNSNSNSSGRAIAVSS